VQPNFLLTVLDVLYDEEGGIEKHLLGLGHRDAMLAVLSNVPIVPVKALET
jgi:hypothetical protein